MTCPPCNGDCNQGRACSAYPIRPKRLRDNWIALACVLAPWVAGWLLLHVLRGCVS
jgi:hypothetical protein